MSSSWCPLFIILLYVSSHHRPPLGLFPSSSSSWSLPFIVLLLVSSLHRPTLGLFPSRSPMKASLAVLSPQFSIIQGGWNKGGYRPDWLCYHEAPQTHLPSACHASHTVLDLECLLGQTHPTVTTFCHSVYSCIFFQFLSLYSFVDALSTPVTSLDSTLPLAEVTWWHAYTISFLCIASFIPLVGLDVSSEISCCQFPYAYCHHC